MKNFELFKKFEDDDNVKNAKLSRFLDDYRTQLIFMMLTIYALFGDDYRLLTCGKAQDASYDAFTIFVLAMFTAEIIISILATYDY